MKCLGRLESIALAAALAVSACSGETGSNNGPSDDGMPPPVSPDSYLRNPSHPLSCERPLTENPSSTQLARLTHPQYANTLRDLFAGLVPEGELPKAQDFADELKDGTFSNNVLGQLGSEAITQAQESAVIGVSAAAVKDLPKLMGCEAKDEAAESGCVDKFIGDFGLRAWRRPLSNGERDAVKNLFAEARKDLDFAPSVRVLVGALLQSPQFMFRIQEGIGEVGDGQSKRLSDYEVASNLSYLIWNSMPDSDLFAVAKKGELSTAAQVEKQARRMLEDPRGRENVRQFQREWLHMDRIESQFSTKSETRFPGYGAPQAEALSRGMDAFLEHAFWDGDHSLSTFFTSSKGFVTDASAEIYGVDKPGKQDVVAVDLDKSQRQGVLTQPAIMAGWANREEQSAILRGAYIMETFLCAPSPAPPDDVVPELKKVDNREELTLRQVVEMTVEVGSCAGCHKVIDGFGFLFENYDAVGSYQTKERDLDIDASNEVIDTLDLDGRYENGVEFVQKLAKSEQAAQCAVEHFYEFALARPPLAEDGCMIAPLTDGFLKNGTDMQQLLVDIVKSPAFRFRSVAQ